MNSPLLLTIQYLEDSPTLLHLERKQVVDRLRRAADRLPFTHLLIGWHVPAHLLEARQLEGEPQGMCFMIWQLLRTLDPDFLKVQDLLCLH